MWVEIGFCWLHSQKFNSTSLISTKIHLLTGYISNRLTPSYYRRIMTLEFMNFSMLCLYSSLLIQISLYSSPHNFLHFIFFASSLNMIKIERYLQDKFLTFLLWQNRYRSNKRLTNSFILKEEISKLSILKKSNKKLILLRKWDSKLKIFTLIYGIEQKRILSKIFVFYLILLITKLSVRKFKKSLKNKPWFTQNWRKLKILAFSY